MKKSLLIIFASLFIFTALFASQSTAAASALPRYGRVTSVGPTQFLVNHHSTQEDTNFSCDAVSLACQNVASSTPNVLPQALQGQRVFLNETRTFALAEGEYQPASGQTIMWRYGLSGGAATQLNSFAIDGQVWNAYISQDGAKAAVITTGNKLLWVDAASGTLLGQMNFDRSGASFITFSPMGNFLAYFKASLLSGARARVQAIIDLRTMTTSQLSEQVAYWDLLSEETRLFAFSPDERQFAYLSDIKGYPTLYFVNLTRTLPARLSGEQLTAKKYSVADFMYVDNDRILFAANRTSSLLWTLYLYNVKTGTLSKVADDFSYGSSMKKIGTAYVAFEQLTRGGSQPVLYNVATRSMRTLLATGLPAQADPLNAKPETIPLKNGSAVLWKPDNFSSRTTYPLVVWLHGGPYRQTSSLYHPYGSYGNFDWMLERLRRQGVAVLKVDYRGSYGYGRPFAQALKNNVGVSDVQDVLAALTAAKTKVRTGKVHLVGNSYGGYLSLRTLVEKPSLFAGAVSISGVTDWLTLVGNNEDSIFTAQFSGPPSQDDATARLYTRAGVIDRLDALSSSHKVLLLHGNQDTSVSYRQSTILRDFMQQAGQSVQLVTYEGEDHVFAKKTVIQDMCVKTLGFVGVADTSGCVLQ